MTYEELTPELQQRFDEGCLKIALLRLQLAESNDSLYDPPRPRGHIKLAKKVVAEAQARVDRWSAISPPPPQPSPSEVVTGPPTSSTDIK